MGRRTLSIFLVLSLMLSVFSNGMIVMLPFMRMAEAVDITSWSDTNTTINVTVNLNEPFINWYDFQNSTDVSRLNNWTDVEGQHKFRINITSYQGWANVKFVNVTAWYDNGSEATVYNQTGAANNHGGNRNMFLQYENSTGTGNISTWRLIWPDDEVSFNAGDCSDIEIDANTHNLTFVFTPRNQTRYAPGDGGWNTASGHNDVQTWNFNITSMDNESNMDYTENEYGIYMYSHITQVTDSPSAIGVPGQNDVQLTPNANVTTQCNANFSLYTNITNLSRDGGGDWINRTNLSAAGGDLIRDNFVGTNPLYIYGTGATYKDHLVNGTDNSVDVTYWVNISLGQMAGNYSSTVTYTINGEA